MNSTSQLSISGANQNTVMLVKYLSLNSFACGHALTSVFFLQIINFKIDKINEL